MRSTQTNDSAPDALGIVGDEPRRGLQRISRSALLVLSAVGLAFMIAEAAIRAFGIGKHDFYAYSTIRGWKLRAGATGWQLSEGRAFVRVNRWGYRGDNWSRIKPIGTLRIAVLGDSFVEAQQLPEQDTACEILGRELAQMIPLIRARHHPGLKRIEVMNFGVDGYGTAQELFTLLEDVWQFSPDIVVLAFFPGNDIRNNSAVLEGDKCRPFFVPHGNAVVRGGPFEDSRRFHLQCFLRFESYRSQLLNALGEARSAIRAMRREHRALPSPPPGISRSLEAIAQTVHEPGTNDLIYRPPINQDWRDAWKVSEAEIEMTEQNVRARHGLFLLVVIGTGIQVMPDAASQARYLRLVGATDPLYPSHRLEALAARKGFAMLDLARPMTTYAQEHQVYFHGFSNTVMGTGHWNQLGNRFAAHLIAGKLAATMTPTESP